MPYFPIILLIIAGTVLVAMLLATFVHELGHALPAIWFTRRPVQMYIGSYGQPQRYLRLKLGWVSVYLTYNPLSWIRGCCIAQTEQLSIWQQIIFIIAGPLAALLLGGLGCYVVFAYDMHGFSKLFWVVFAGVAVWQFVVNLYPWVQTQGLTQNVPLYNDGYLLRWYWRHRKLWNQLLNTRKAFNQEDYTTAIGLLEPLLAERYFEEELYRMAIIASLHTQQAARARQLSETLLAHAEATAADLATYGLALEQLGQYQAAEQKYLAALEADPQNAQIHNNLGYLYLEMEAWDKTLPVLDTALALDAQFAYAYNNRGLARLMQGQVQPGMADIAQVLSLDATNSYAHRNQGIGYYLQQYYQQALAALEQAKHYDPLVPHIQTWISKTQEKLAANA